MRGIKHMHECRSWDSRNFTPPDAEFRVSFFEAPPCTLTTKERTERDHSDARVHERAMAPFLRTTSFETDLSVRHVALATVCALLLFSKLFTRIVYAVFPNAAAPLQPWTRTPTERLVGGGLLQEALTGLSEQGLLLRVGKQRGNSLRRGRRVVCSKKMGHEFRISGRKVSLKVVTGGNKIANTQRPVKMYLRDSGICLFLGGILLFLSFCNGILLGPELTLKI